MINGWRFVFANSHVEKDFINTPKKICVAAHTTPYFDGIITYAALQHFGEENAIVYVRGPSPYFPKWCKQIRWTGGFLQNECNELKNSAGFCRVIFPSGGTVKWKTGFYVLAKKLNAKIVILGIDFKTRQVVVDSVINPKETFEETKNICIYRLRQYEPGPFCFTMRVLCNYGCETYMYNIIQICIFRCLFYVFLSIGACCLFYHFYNTFYWNIIILQ